MAGQLGAAKRTPLLKRPSAASAPLRKSTAAKERCATTNKSGKAVSSRCGYASGMRSATAHASKTGLSVRHQRTVGSAKVAKQASCARKIGSKGPGQSLPLRHHHASAPALPPAAAAAEGCRSTLSTAAVGQSSRRQAATRRNESLTGADVAVVKVAAAALRGLALPDTDGDAALAARLQHEEDEAFARASSSQALAVSDGGNVRGGCGHEFGLTAVQVQKRERRDYSGADGSHKESHAVVQHRKLSRRSSGGEQQSLERQIAKHAESVTRLANGRTVVTETVTIQKVTYLE
mmetsp:Transcript_31453/g.82790  ORF Transcript_31453/g.82790 Transcript_31453/m.82790 type:complete len:292 (+) Transcript_31453:44-919(+)